MLEVNHICKRFGTREVLRDISFSVAAGQVCGLIGSNGAGKTTLLRIVCCLVPPDSGHVLFNGHAMTDDDLSHVGYLPEERGLYRRMRVGEQLTYLMRLKGLSRGDADSRLAEWAQRLGMEGWMGRPVSQLSKGMQQKVQFVAAVAHAPQLLILDEPFSGFDSDNAAILMREVSRLRDEGTAIILSTHNMQAADTLCQQIVSL